ncbi:MAG TPA: AAA family ATPase [Solirubrobacterales bacterium]|jgi:chromosome partitioning protein|nr:AAA family ATPase [Solirubrobacterales bacterium]
MGFLSRKSKRQSVTVEEPHPIVEELQRMEEAVPERPSAEDFAPEYSDSYEEETYSDDYEGSEEYAEAEPEPTPEPVAEVEVKVESEAAAPAAPAPGPEAVIAVAEEEDDDGRIKAVDLIAPTRLDFIAEQRQEAEKPVKTAEVFVFANQKGGVAKTTTTLNLAVAFAESGYRVLCIDLDPQGNLTMSQGIDPDKVEKSLYDVLVNDMPISEIIVKREIDIAVASIDLAGAEIAMSTKIGRERSLEKSLKEVEGDYDFVCIDTPPSLGLLTINALTAADKVIVPVQCEYLSMRGLVQLQNTLKMIQENLNPDVRIEGILPTMLDSRTVHAKEAVEILEENFGDLVFRSRIKKAIKFAEAPVKGASVLKYDSGSSAASYYRELAKEVLANGSA